MVLLNDFVTPSLERFHHFLEAVDDESGEGEPKRHAGQRDHRGQDLVVRARHARVRPGVCLEAPRLPHGVEITVVVGEAAIVIVRLVVIRTVAVATVSAQEVPRRAQDGQHDKCVRRRDYKCRSVIIEHHLIQSIEKLIVQSRGVLVPIVLMLPRLMQRLLQLTCGGVDAEIPLLRGPFIPARRATTRRAAGRGRRVLCGSAAEHAEGGDFGLPRRTAP
mmetsp:Transcript_36545/g.97664  ORF Transcript_36545/g.97664 Transcript_36545/m.97664 type:complete len:219 (+) Transcript_36545:2981-3637(+)